jgi:predicted nucleic acid-binding protein
MLLSEGGLAHIIEIETEDLGLAWMLMRQYAERRLSAADATAFAIVRRRKIPTVISFDADFAIVLSDRKVLGATG